MIALEHEADRTWMDRAACRGADAELWFPDRGQSTAYAVDVCGRCPVKADCAEYAINARVHHGVWGGLTAEQRKHLTWLRDNGR